MIYYYLINVGGHSLLQVEVREGGMRSAYAVYYGLMRGFPADRVTIHEVAKDISTDKCTVRELKPKAPPTGRIKR